MLVRRRRRYRRNLRVTRRRRTRRSLFRKLKFKLRRKLKPFTHPRKGRLTRRSRRKLRLRRLPNYKLKLECYAFKIRRLAPTKLEGKLKLRRLKIRRRLLPSARKLRKQRTRNRFYRGVRKYRRGVRTFRHRGARIHRQANELCHHMHELRCTPREQRAAIQVNLATARQGIRKFHLRFLRKQSLAVRLLRNYARLQSSARRLFRNPNARKHCVIRIQQAGRM